MRVAILGYTGAIGSAITERLSLNNSYKIFGLNSKNFNIMENEVNLNKLPPCDVFIHCAGTFGGLKQYTGNEILAAPDYLLNMEKVVNHLEKNETKMLINISSSSVGNNQNFNKTSNYFEYVSLKSEIERIFMNSSVETVLTLRPSNIVSRFERVQISNHVLASLYRNITQNKDLNYVVWSHENDWREFTDADELALLVNEKINEWVSNKNRHERKLFYCSNGEKVYIRNIVRSMSRIFRQSEPASITFTQPHRLGPVPELLDIFVENDNYVRFDKNFYTSLSEFCNAEN